MAVTRINNNQITTAISGNAIVGINAAAKLQNYSITSNKIVNSLVYGSDLTISGNLTVNGTTTTVDTVNTLIQDPLLTLADGQTSGTPSVDIGLIGLRGNQNSSFIGWKEDQSEFVAALSNTTVSNTTANITSYANFHANTIIANLNLSVIGNVVGTNTNFTGNITAGNLITPGIISATGNILGGNISTTGTITFATVTGTNASITGNIITGNLNSLGAVSAVGVVQGGNISTTGNVNTAQISATGDVTIQGNLVVNGNTTFINSNVITTNEKSITLANNQSTGANVDGSGIDVGNTTIAYWRYKNSTVSWESNIGITPSSNNTLELGNTSFFWSNLYTNAATVTANITSGNILNSGIVSVTGNIDSAANIVASANVIGGNITTVGIASLGNIKISGDNIDQLQTNRTINLNGATANTNISMSGYGNANLFYLNAATNTISFGTSTQTTNALVAFNATTSVLLPVGNTLQRPGTGVTGMFRFNSTNNQLEVYDATQWQAVGATTFTVIDDQQFNGDGSTVAFTLSTSQTTNSCIVSINGIVQVPSIAYSVTTTTLTFTEAPASGDLIDVRSLTTTQTIISISNSPGNAIIATSPTTSNLVVTGNLNPIANVTYSLGNNTNRWSNIYLSGNSIYLGNIILQQGSSNSFQVYQSDGTTPAPLSLGNSVISTTGNITGGNLDIGSGTAKLNNIINGGSNATGNIGNSTGYFNTAFIKATSAQYADLAEKYIADADYTPGTVLAFGGEKEVTVSSVDSDRAVAGVVSTNPSYIMNSTLEAEHVATVAFTGRVPTSVTGAVAKGDLMVSNGDGTARAESDPKVGAVIGKALEDFAGESGVIEVVVGRF